MAVSPTQYQKTFLASDEADKIRQQLIIMEGDPKYATKSFYSPGANEDISFTDKHFTYISTHPNVQPCDYIANLRLKTKLR